MPPEIPFVIFLKVQISIGFPLDNTPISEAILSAKEDAMTEA